MNDESLAENQDFKDLTTLTESTPEEDLNKVKIILSSILKSVKATKIYLLNNPMRSRFLKEAYLNISEFLQGHNEFTLTLTDSEIIYNKHSIYNNDNRMESFAFKLYIDGIREITFQKGMTKDELELFLSITGKDLDSSKSDDDLSTLLWDSGMENIIYTIDEDFFNCNTDVLYKETKNPIISFDSILSMELDKCLTKKTYIPPKLSTLENHEIESIKKELEIEEKKEPVDDLISILGAILVGEESLDSFSETLEIMDNIYKDLLKQLDFTHSCQILLIYKDLLEEKDLSEQFKNKINDSLNTAGDADTCSMLAESFKDKEPDDYDMFNNLFTLLPGKSTRSIVDLLCMLENMKQRKVLCEILVKRGEKDISPILAKLDDSRWYVVRNMIYILAKISGPKSIDNIKHLAFHKDERVRREILRLLESIKSKESNQILLKMVDDDVKTIRIAAIRQLGLRKDKNGLEHLKSIIINKQFKDKKNAEKREILTAILTIEGENAIAEFKQLIIKRKWYGATYHDFDLTLPLVDALSKIKADYATEMLKEIAQTKNKTILDACNKALSSDHKT